MELKHRHHLAYCTNIHRGETWSETFDALQRYTLAVKERVCPDAPYAIGLRLSDQAARELQEPSNLSAFREWLDRHQCYIFTINGFPFGRFHGERIKEQVYLPDWTTQARLDYTNRLFDLLAELVPDGVEGSVSTVPGSYKAFIHSDHQVRAIQENLWRCVEHIGALSRRTGKSLHLGLEPEPLGYVETSEETVALIESIRREHGDDPRLRAHLGVNYDTCHLAVEFEDSAEALRRFHDHGVKISKLHLSSALKVRPGPETVRALQPFADSHYLHQVIERRPDGDLRHYPDLDVALQEPDRPGPDSEWRVHFHIPLHSSPTSVFDNTTDHILGVLDRLKENHTLCSHLEMETYTWEVLPPELKSRDVTDQLVGEYAWCLERLRERGLA